ncbi:MAG: hypothetical protein ACOH14_12345 [Rhodoglobus sp.]
MTTRNDHDDRRERTQLVANRIVAGRLSSGRRSLRAVISSVLVLKYKRMLA